MDGCIDVENFLGPDGAIIISALLSDGSVSGNEIKFFTTDKTLNEFVWNTLRKIFNVKINGKSGTFRSRLIAEFLRFFTNTFRTVPFRKDGKIIDWSQPKISEFVINGSDLLKKMFLKVFFSCDGGILIGIVWRNKAKTFGIQPEIVLACKNPILKIQLLTLLGNLGFNPCDSDSSHLALLGKDLLKFREEIGFVNGSVVVHSPFWNKTEKNDILALAILIQKLGPDIIPPHLRKDKNKRVEIKEFLKLVILKMKRMGIKHVEKQLSKEIGLNRFLRTLSENEILVLKELKKSPKTFSDIRKVVNNRISRTSGLLGRMKKDGMVINSFEKWAITAFGEDILNKSSILPFSN